MSARPASSRLKIGFYLTGNQPVARVLPLLARAAMRSDARMLVVGEDEAQLQALSRALWEAHPEDFLAHGMAGGAHDARQPILLATTCDAANGADLLALADGLWREEAERFARVFLLFEESGRDAARRTWRLFDGRTDVQREFHELEGGRWVKKG